MGTENKPAIDTGNLKGDDKTLEVAEGRLRACIQATEDSRSDMLDDLYFYDNKAWKDDDVKSREVDKRPALTMNKLPAFVAQVVNEMRTNPAQIKIRAQNNFSVDNAIVRDGMIRHIFNNGDAKSAQDTAAHYQVICGLGYFRVLTQYVEGSFDDQELVLDRIDDPLSVYVPSHLCKRLDWSDMPYCFIRYRFSKDDFHEEYPTCDMTSYDLKGQGNNDNWYTEDHIYVYEYFEVVKNKTKKYMLSDNTTVIGKENIPEGMTVVKERDYVDRKIVWRKITRYEVLEEQDFPGIYIPIVPVLGTEVVIDGRKTYVGLIRNAKDAQKAYNLFYSNFTEVMCLQPLSPFIAAEGQIEGHESEWASANTKHHAVLPYKPITEAGSLLPPPQRQPAPSAGTALMQGVTLASEQMKEVTGLFNNSMGDKEGDQSGKAIVALQHQGSISTYHFVGNMATSMRHVARILNGLISKIYTTERQIRILGPDNTDKIMWVNAQTPQAQNTNGKTYSTLDDSDNYAIESTIGPSYDTQRTETTQTLVNIAQAVPSLAAVIGDLIVKSTDFALAQEAGDRIKRMIQQSIPGVIVDDDENAGGPPTEEKMQAIIQDMHKLMQQHQMTMQENMQMKQIIGQLSQQVKDKQGDLQLKADSIAVKAKTEIQKAQLSLQSQVLQHQHENNGKVLDLGLRLHEMNQQQNVSGQEKPVSNTGAPGANSESQQ
jgi:Phage P22-like portal protein/Catechol dioxygenase N terminus